ncbi:hypothetical protein [Plasticicumulans lactativorans]|uniref:hypothetical protein n=1 Tax=Plasticicumulans lactativorans TaxID=1133106 RepID=UPI001043EA90|nr:hypothetical protein [Plasticicumulans lactativorans]
MANWLERARQMNPSGVERPAANRAERHPTAATAVPEADTTVIAATSIGSHGSAAVAGFHEADVAVPMTARDESAIRSWLAQIGETDATIIVEVLERCCTDADARRYFTQRTAAPVRPDPFDDDRRRCDQCANLTGSGLCLAAWRGGIVASRRYTPRRDTPRRCEGYTPGPDDPDCRPGRERWPGLLQRGDHHADT